MHKTIAKFDGVQLAAARALAGLTMQQLAEMASVNYWTLHRLENGGEILVSEKKRHGHVEIAVWSRIVDALACQGVIFIPGNKEHGLGVARMIDP